MELNLYGVSNDVYVIGEVTVRAGANLVGKLLKKLRRKVILVIYAALPMVELVDKVEEKGVWLLRATEEFYRPEKMFIEL